MAKVYSTETGRLCPGCEQPVDGCICSQLQGLSSAKKTGDGIVRIRRETKGRKGAGVTLIEGLDMPGDALKKLAKQIKAHCSSGGAIKNGIIEVQGDQREKIKTFLENRDFRVKLAGG